MARGVLLETDLLYQGSELRCSFNKLNKIWNYPEWEEEEEEKEEILFPEQHPPKKILLKHFVRRKNEISRLWFEK